MSKAFKTFVAFLGAIAISGSAVHAFDRETTDALKACHDQVWNVDEYADLPNAAISVWPASSENDLIKVYWVVDWTDPDIKAAGQCEYQGEEVINFQPFK